VSIVQLIVLQKVINMAARSKSWVCGRLFVGNAGSNHAGDGDVYVLWILCVCAVRYRSLRLADHSSRGVLMSVVCLSVIVKPR
jgi:endo-1,4-beta-D-glucanase Y